MKQEILRCKGLTKIKHGGLVLNNLDFSLYEGEFLGLVGLNGSGRTTLAHALCGLDEVSQGQVYVQGKPVSIHSVEDAHRYGIYCIQGKTNIFPACTVAENLCIVPTEKQQGWFIRPKFTNFITKSLMGELGVDLSPSAKGKDLSLAQCHIVELTRAVADKAKVVILDDIMMNYTDREYWNLALFLEKMKEKGISLIIIESKLERITRLADRIVVLKNGREEGIFFQEDFHSGRIEKILIGEEFTAGQVRPIAQSNQVLLGVNSVYTSELADISFYVKKGEAVGFLDEDGECASVVRLLRGLAPVWSGEITLDGTPLRLPMDSRSMIEHGIGYIGYYKNSLFRNLSLGNNLTIAALSRFQKKGGLLNVALEKFAVKNFVETMRIDPALIHQDIHYADNWTQLNVALYKWIVARMNIVVMENPFSGIDMLMHNSIYDFISAAKRRNMGIIYTSYNPNEIRKVCDRVYVMKNNRITGELIEKQPSAC
ncbi:ATP-binding cassette domain-containing protein [Youxingia wuxianensis]|uniref:Sugar ABC transporter ATP-binding protein n=1 Tax=Youxingia wuxianensis TaxID=2763678 RepID=A0A926EPL0_9FIRM|nr:ATP-binding cassette domain-containing protein [Youxingia wuxianensis]MBC8585426.1 sugar ABC transporter ATP-binding protein [Youxingia wuxianensis]